MRVWIDLANSPHVAVFEPVVAALLERGDEVVLTARDHAQTLELARASFRGADITVCGGESPRNRTTKATSVAERAIKLRSFAHRARPDVAVSHGSYAQVTAAWLARTPRVTMMDYEHQPANHLSFRLADRVVVPEVFPTAELRRFGAHGSKVVRYPGFKEELYLGFVRPAPLVLEQLELDPSRVIVVLRPAPDGALYHRARNERFEHLLARVAGDDAIQAVVLPRGSEQFERYRRLRGVIIPGHAVDGRSLLAHSDVMIGAGGTMTREAALLGTPTYTMFAGRLAAVDAELIRIGMLHDLRADGPDPEFVKKPARDPRAAEARGRAILDRVLAVLDAVAIRRGTRLTDAP